MASSLAFEGISTDPSLVLGLFDSSVIDVWCCGGRIGIQTSSFLLSANTTPLDTGFFNLNFNDRPGMETNSNQVEMANLRIIKNLSWKASTFFSSALKVILKY